MSLTISDYLLQQRASFEDVPLNDVDSLVLSTIAYFNFEKGHLGKVVPSERVELPVAICGISHQDLFGRLWLSRMGGDEFLHALLESPRFMDLQVGYYINEVSSHFEKQFSAIMFFLPEGGAYVAYRGTDNSLAGWKEDFNLTFMKEVPSQVSARTYLEDIAGVVSGSLYVGGHSKGGNLAEYAALTCRPQTFERVKCVFNLDGPGFAFTPSARIKSPAYLSKLRKIVPEDSVFGMLMEERTGYRVVKSSGVLFAQHASTHWAVEGDDFVGVDAISPEAAILAGTLNSWAKLYEPREREMFIDAVFGILSAANSETWAEMGESPASSTLAIVEATAQLPAEMRSTIFKMLRDIAPIIGSEALKRALGAAGTFNLGALSEAK